MDSVMHVYKSFSGDECGWSADLWSCAMCCLDFDDMFHILEVKLCDLHNWLQENLSPQIELLEVEHSCCFFFYTNLEKVSTKEF